ncbi:MAG: hypothetical protein ACIAXF_15340 [Phycisphaerales bacterium JB063]
MTGSWYGGALFGGVMGLIVISGINAAGQSQPDPEAREAEQDDNPND